MLLRLQRNLPSRPRQRFALPMLILLPQELQKQAKTSARMRSKEEEALLADPNWPNDTVLEGLAQRLLNSEDFNS